jgi:hypothetical protein
MSKLALEQTYEFLEEKASKLGLSVFIPLSNEAFLDLDDPKQDINEEVLHHINEYLGLTCISTCQTKSVNGNKHLYLRFDAPIPEIDKVFIQICLGSDMVKELLSFMQIKKNERCVLTDPYEYSTDLYECPIALFETREEAKRVDSWRLEKSKT